MKAYNKANETKSYVQHPLQVEVYNKLKPLAVERFCEVYEVRQQLAREMVLDFMYNYQTSEAYKEAKALGLEVKLLRHVEEVASVQAQIILYNQYPVYTEQGERFPAPIGMSGMICPHLSLPADVKRYSRLVLKEWKGLSSIEINLASEVRKWIGLPEHGGPEKPIYSVVINDDAFL